MKTIYIKKKSKNRFREKITTIEEYIYKTPKYRIWDTLVLIDSTTSIKCYIIMNMFLNDKLEYEYNLSDWTSFTEKTIDFNLSREEIKSEDEFLKILDQEKKMILELIPCSDKK